MDILLSEDNVVLAIGTSITFGKLDPTDLTVEKWKVNPHLFMVVPNARVEHEVVVPSNVIAEKFIYTNGAFQINPAWKEPVTMETLQKQITDMQLIIATLLEGGTI